MRIEGIGAVGFVGPLDEPLDELIFEATQLALRDAELNLNSVGGIFLAASDLLDGRGISTMTLSAAAGSFAKPEIRVCEDGIGALLLARSFLRATNAEPVIVAAWSKLSDADPEAIERTGVEPIFRRDVLLSDEIVRGLKRSRRQGRVTTTSKRSVRPVDGAVSLVASRGRDGGTEIRGLATSTGRYLDGNEDSVTRIKAASEAACRDASVAPGDLATVFSYQLTDEDFSRLRDALGLPETVSVTGEPTVHMGYAAGLFAVSRAARLETGTSLALGATGLAGQSAYAAVVGGG
ncbi:MAG: hypothetical protein ACRDH8_09185 [Actinomycetota bacterium]